jgi:hypothetical protein
VVNFVLARAPANQQAAMDEAQDACLRALPNLMTGQKSPFEEAVRTLHSLKPMTVINPNAAPAA